MPNQLEQPRFVAWYKLRKSLETSSDPLSEAAAFFLKLPRTKFYTDPYDQSTWPTAWELIEENEYCPFNIILGICYSLQLTDRFKDSSPEISISFDKKDKTVYYLLTFENKVYGYVPEEWVDVKSLPTTLNSQKVYSMKKWY